MTPERQRPIHSVMETGLNNAAGVDHGVASGVPPAVVARQLGHYSSMTTELYYGHISESAVDAMIRQKIDRADLVPAS
ncbi:MAG: hypothetical protein OXH87_16275 [Rhodospirillaceae bacterium]|nr:hypothetical protein [Rhodospirillaceae bacterium]